MARRSILFGAGALALALLGGACGEEVTAPPEALDEVAVADAADAPAAHLPTLRGLLRRTREALEARGGDPEAEALLARARELSREAREAARGGDRERARELLRESRRAALRAVLLVLGGDVAGEAVTALRGALSEVEARIAGRTVPEPVAKRLDRVRELVAGAEAALAAGDGVGALERALAGADVLRSLRPGALARRAVERATRALRAAREAVGDSPTEEEARALRRAHRLLEEAGSALEARRPREAIRAARASLHLSLRVLRGRRGS